MKPDKERLARKFDDIRKAVARLSEFINSDRAAFLSNEDSLHITRSHLLIAAEAVIAVCYHLSAKVLRSVPKEYSGCFEDLKAKKLISGELADYLIKFVGLRNRMVHRYEEINYGVVFDNLKSICEKLESFIAEVSLLTEKEQS